MKRLWPKIRPVVIFIVILAALGVTLGLLGAVGEVEVALMLVAALGATVVLERFLRIRNRSRTSP